MRGGIPQVSSRRNLQLRGIRRPRCRPGSLLNDGGAGQACEGGIGAGEARPLYVIGSDVPLPGGATMPGEALTVTPVAEVEEIITLTRAAFMQRGLGDAWERVIAVVVQPGVEFDHSLVHDYRPARAEALSRFIETEERLVYEAHSTDYQTGSALAELVRDHFAILKVGPW